MKKLITLSALVVMATTNPGVTQSMNDLMNATLACDFKIKGINGMKYGIKMENGEAVLSFPEDSGVSESKENEYQACVMKELQSS